MNPGCGLPDLCLKGNIYAGEVYDATKEIKGWSEVGTQLNGWKML